MPVSGDMNNDTTSTSTSTISNNDNDNGNNGLTTVSNQPPAAGVAAAPSPSPSSSPSLLSRVKRFQFSSSPHYNINCPPFPIHSDLDIEETSLSQMTSDDREPRNNAGNSDLPMTVSSEFDFSGAEETTQVKRHRSSSMSSSLLALPPSLSSDTLLIDGHTAGDPDLISPTEQLEQSRSTTSTQQREIKCPAHINSRNNNNNNNFNGNLDDTDEDERSASETQSLLHPHNLHRCPPRHSLFSPRMSCHPPSSTSFSSPSCISVSVPTYGAILANSLAENNHEVTHVQGSPMGASSLPSGGVGLKFMPNVLSYGYLLDDPEQPLIPQHHRTTSASSGSSGNSLSSGGKSWMRCRICWEGTEQRRQLGPLVSPCLCKGSVKFIHRWCLEREGKDHCTICNAPYIIEDPWRIAFWLSMKRTLSTRNIVFAATVCFFMLIIFALCVGLVALLRL